MQIHGKNVVLTGASMGIGVTIAKALAKKGANLALIARSKDKLETLQEELRPVCDRVICIPADLSDKDVLFSLSKRVDAEFGPVDILINNAGIAETAAFETLSEQEIEYINTLNLTAPMILCHAFLKGMLQRRSGHIVNVASLGGMTSVAYQETYCATKHGLVGFSRSLRASLKIRNASVGVSLVCPGFISEAGMHHDNKSNYGLTTPQLAGELPPQAVADGIISAIENDTAEVIVNKTPVRALIALSVLSPRLSEWLSNRFQLHDFYEDLANLKGRGAKQK